MKRIEELAGRRSIPACAGEPKGSTYTPTSPKVYPRVCGGTDTTPPAAAKAEGLSPRVRGNPEVLIYRDAKLRSIPACAGEPHPVMLCGQQ